MKTLLALVAILLQTPAPATYSVSDRVMAFPGDGAMPSKLMLSSYALHEGWGQGKTTTIHPDGTFEFTNVPPGECDLNFYYDRQSIERAGQTSTGSYDARSTAMGLGLNFSFSGHNVTGLQIKAPANLNGRFVMADGGSLPSVAVISTTPLSVNNSFRSGRSMWTQASPGSDAQFTLRVFPGENKITVVGTLENMPGSRPISGGYRVKSMTYGAVDVIAKGLVLTELPTSILVITLER